ncbi:glutamate--cysteine ligase [Streptomyces sp. NPDC006879]|uniref:carboxylate-amine ligase n=1 Tax=Streptomyces sp. NPDC006879 TaxID=3364767 RepID=UPI003678F086
MITVGVEEEYLLVDPATGLPVPRVEELRTAAGLEPIVDTAEVQAELLQAQIEVATPVCHDLHEVGGHLLRMRHALGSAAERIGCRIAMSAAAPLRGALPVPVTPSPRYLQMQTHAPQLVDEQLINGMHVHVGVPDREAGVAVLNRIRVWLPTLLAMSANSPLWDGGDTGFASWRTIVFSRWPVSGPPPCFADLTDYENRIKALSSSGTIVDPGQLYWQARLSERYPTVEVRCPDVQLRADEAVLFAGVIRALVATAIHETSSGTPLPVCPPELLQAANWHAARYGLDGPLVDPEGALRSPGDLMRTLLHHLAPALDESGDTREVGSLVQRLLQEGTGADRQRRARAAGGVPALIDLITLHGAAT